MMKILKKAVILDVIENKLIYHEVVVNIGMFLLAKLLTDIAQRFDDGLRITEKMEK